MSGQGLAAAVPRPPATGIRPAGSIHAKRGGAVGKSALVVDDSATMREMVSLTLREAGFEPLTGGNGREGLERLGGRRVDVIITDLNMPVMDGLEFIRAVRAREEYRFTPILMLTTESQATRKAEGKAAGATGWIVKPFQPEALLHVLRKVVPLA